MTDQEKKDRFLYEKPELIEIDLLTEEVVARGECSEPVPFDDEPPPGT